MFFLNIPNAQPKFKSLVVLKVRRKGQRFLFYRQSSCHALLVNIYTSEVLVPNFYVLIRYKRISSYSL